MSDREAAAALRALPFHERLVAYREVRYLLEATCRGRNRFHRRLAARFYRQGVAMRRGGVVGVGT